LSKRQSPEPLTHDDVQRKDWLRRKNLDRATPTIDELAIRFLEHVIVHYAKDGDPMSEVACSRVFAVTGLMSLPPNCPD
jgi:hypothetical protein